MKVPSFFSSLWKPIVISLVIITLCLIPADDPQKLDILKITFEDLLVHFIMFFIFSSVLAYDLNKHFVFAKKFTVVAIISLTVSLLLGLTTEMLQYSLIFLNRTANIGDFVFDSLGSMIGVITIWLIKR
jgi:VanZ family protein